MAYDNTNRGTLFRNEKKQHGPKQPDHRGTINIDGREYQLSAWVRESKRTGKKFFSLAVTPAEAKQQGVASDDDLDESFPPEPVAHPPPDAAAPVADTAKVDYKVAFAIFKIARKLWPDENGEIGSGFVELLRKFGVEEVDDLTPSQAEQVRAALERRLEQKQAG